MCQFVFSAVNSEKSDLEWLSDTTKKHNLPSRNLPVQNVTKCTKSLRTRTSALPAVELPHPGMSYNPSLEDHQDLLKIVVNEESKLIKENKHLTKCTEGMFQKMTEDKKNVSVLHFLQIYYVYITVCLRWFVN